MLPKPRAPWLREEPAAPVTAIVRSEVQPPEAWHSAGGVLSTEELTDQRIVDLWLSQFENQNTRRSYERTIEAFLATVGRLDRLTIEAIANWRKGLTGAPATQGVRISAVKSLLTFCNQFGIHPVNLGRLLAWPKVKFTLAERIMTRDQVLAMIEAARGHARDYALLRTLYAAGCRVSELVGLKWRDVQQRDDGKVQLTLFTKGGWTHYVLLDNADTVAALLAIRHGRDDDQAVFESRTGSGRLDRVSVHRLLKKWAKAAGLPPEVARKVSPHWFRHAHASHSLDRGAPIHEVQQTLGHADISTTGRYLHIRPGKSSGRFLGI